jgi:predicted Fe-Mo cluster-binding NifX family protein
MKIAMPHLDGNLNPHFGTSREFIVFEAENGNIKGKKIITNEILHNHGGLAQLLKAEGASVVITGGIGRPMAQALQQAGFGVLTGASGDAEQVAKDFLNGTLVTGPSSCSCGGHQHGHGHGHGHGQGQGN